MSKLRVVDPETMAPGDVQPERIDGRCLAARTYRRALAELFADLGGEAALSFAERSLARRAVAFELWLGTVEARAMRGEDVTAFMPVYSQATNTLLGLFRQLGIKRRPKEIPDLQTYLRQSATDPQPTQEGTDAAT